jgi:hypothetical protein
MRINGKFAVAPTMTEAFELHEDIIGSKLRVASTGTIVAYDSTKRTVSVSIGETLQLPNGTLIPIPAPLLDVPVFTVQGGVGSINGGVHIGMPIEPGDECLVVFNDFNLDNWFTAGGQQVPADARQHDISDGIAFIGLNSLANALVTFLIGQEGGLSSDQAKVAVNAETGLITIANRTGSLATILTTMLTAQAASFLALSTDPGLQMSTQGAAATAAADTTAAIAALEALLY